MDDIASCQVITDSASCVVFGKDAYKGGVIYLVMKGSNVPPLPKSATGKTEKRYNPRYQAIVGKGLDTPPVFHGKYGPDSFMQWQGQEFHKPRYSPAVEDKDELYGATVVSFVVTERGEVRDVKVLEKHSDAFNRRVELLISDSPNWEPATKGGVPVPSVVVYPVDVFDKVYIRGHRN